MTHPNASSTSTSTIIHHKVCALQIDARRRVIGHALERLSSLNNSQLKQRLVTFDLVLDMEGCRVRDALSYAGRVRGVDRGVDIDSKYIYIEVEELAEDDVNVVTDMMSAAQQTAVAAMSDLINAAHDALRSSGESGESASKALERACDYRERVLNVLLPPSS